MASTNGSNGDVAAFDPEAGLPVAVLAEPVDGEDNVHEIAFDEQEEEEQQADFHVVDEIVDAPIEHVVAVVEPAENNEAAVHALPFADRAEAMVAEIENEAILGGEDEQHPLPVRFANLRGRNAESISSYLFDMIREGHTCTSVLGGWSRVLEGGCNRVVDHCTSHQYEAFYISSNGRTALHEACLRGSCSHVIKALLAANSIGATDRDHQGNTPLHLLFVDYSSIYPQEEIDSIVRELLAVSPAFLAAASNVEGSTALHMACSAPETMVPPNSLLQLLEANPGAAFKVNNLNQTPLRLHCGRRNASVEAARILYEANPEAIFVLADGWAPLHYAAANCNFELIRFLVQANPEAARVKTERGETALHLLCRQPILGIPQLPSVDILLEAYPDAVTQRDSHHQYTPLHLLCRSGGPRVSLEVVKRLLEANSQATEIADSEHYLPLHYGCENGCEAPIISALLQRYPSAAYSMTRKQDSALSLACTCNKSVETVQMLIQANADALVKKNDYGFAPLHCVCRAYQPRMGIVQALLEACPSCVTLKTHGGETPVHLACSNSGAFVGVLQLLTVAQNNFQELDRVVRPDKKPMTNKVGNTPRAYQIVGAGGSNLPSTPNNSPSFSLLLSS
jgi:ankyrin repeat protein